MIPADAVCERLVSSGKVFAVEITLVANGIIPPCPVIEYRAVSVGPVPVGGAILVPVLGGEHVPVMMAETVTWTLLIAKKHHHIKTRYRRILDGRACCKI